ncbi:hypothetical protein H0I31_04060 [Tenacibaculum sp. AHE15PA]|uniref:hypothetical protein n=1 Tax=unclassified Tenacibaculum TaxID=2635139 RepID=UPI001C4FFB09|nr:MULTISPECIES: hypothetical protein [unclassified Tenacibaculum]QXP72883.1 hypothetical protein H0I30_09320 [Tenacibaculum sp. AHE14PA]QXP76797.1 hypothetical protein H0I31_04060 [Tenacibaculum sp. AHE15PA]
MLKKTFFILLIVMYGCSNDTSIQLPIKTAQVDFVKTYGGTKNESGRSVVETSDGGYIVLGFTQSIDGDIITTKTTVQYDYWLLKFDANDELQWQKTYGGSNDEKAYKIIQTNDNGFAVIGYSKSDDGDLNSNQGFEDVWILKLNASGNILWKTSTGFSGTDQGFSLIQTSDNGYFIASILDVTASGGLGNVKTAAKHAGGDYWGIKLDTNGTIEWRKYFGGTNTDTCYDITETSDGYLMVGSSDSDDVDITNNKGGYDFWVVKTDKAGTLLWEKSFGGDEIDEARAITTTDDGNFIIIGDTRSANKDVTQNNGGADLWAIKITSDGDLIWQKNYGGTSFDVGRSIRKTIDGGFLISGSSRSADNGFTNKGQNDALILKIDANGNQQWQKTIGGTEIDFCYDAIELTNGNIIAVGESSSNNQDIATNKGFSDLLIIKLK